MDTKIKTLQEILIPGEAAPSAEWQLKAIQSEQCISYVAWNTRTQEALVVDPKDHDLEAYRSIAREMPHTLWLAVIDTHTHADHISAAADVARELGAPLVMHSLAPSPRVQLRITQATRLPSKAEPVQLIPTPGHTQDSIVLLWGPFLFGGDTVLFADSGRDDLPGGNSLAHYRSLQHLKAQIPANAIVLPGHDAKEVRASTWATQLKLNPSLIQDEETFVRESDAFDGPAPALLKKSLRENFK